MRGTTIVPPVSTKDQTTRQEDSSISHQNAQCLPLGSLERVSTPGQFRVPEGRVHPDPEEAGLPLHAQLYLTQKSLCQSQGEIGTKAQSQAQASQA